MKHIRFVLATVLLLALVALVLIISPASVAGSVNGGILRFPAVAPASGTLDPALKS